MSSLGESYYVLSQSEYDALMAALDNVGTPWATAMKADFNYVSPLPSWSGYHFGRILSLDDTEREWLEENEFFFDDKFFSYSTQPSVIEGL